MRYLLFAVLPLAVVLMCTAQSAARSGNEQLFASDLTTMCADKSSESTICSAYIAGYSAGFYYASTSAQAGYVSCVPHEVTGIQARVIVTKFMNVHPEMMQQGAQSVVALALIDAFPCARAH